MLVRGTSHHGPARSHAKPRSTAEVNDDPTAPRVAVANDVPPRTQPIKDPAALRSLGLEGLVTGAKASARAETGLAHDVNIKIYGGEGPKQSKLDLPIK